MSNKKSISRRQFLKQAAGATIGSFGIPFIVKASALGGNGTIAPSERITMGCIGIGMQGVWNLRSFIVEKDCQVVAVCDLDKNHLQDGANMVNEHYGNSDCAKYHDFRELLAREDIDAVSLALPDHWHAIPAIEAAESGKDIFGEKPLSHTLREGRAICDAVKRYGRIWQTGSWQRSESRFRFACELIRNGRIGKVHTVEIALPSGHIDFANTKGQETFEPPPAELNYDFWLGPAPYEPYCVARVHMNWRWNLDYGGGQLMDWIGHHLDIAHWGLDLDDTGPVEIEGHGDFPRTGVWNSPTDFEVIAKYANGLTMVITSRIEFQLGNDDWGSITGTKWIGQDGWICVTRGGIDAQPKELLKEKFGPNDIHLFRSPGHWRNFLDCVKSRQTAITPCEVAHRSVTPGHLGQIAMLLGRKIRFNPNTEEIIDDPTATRLLGKAMRSPWHL